MKSILKIIERSQFEFGSLLQRALDASPLTRQQYQRYLSMQYHLTRGVQSYFLRAAAHSDLVRKKRLRKFLFDFANEEEQHYLVAANDLAKLGLPLLEEPFDVLLWHVYFRSLVDEHPFLRLGAASVLENLSGGSARHITRLALKAPFLNSENTKFLVLHQHEALPHGDQIVSALEAADLSSHQIEQLGLGARQGMVLYLRMAEWALFPTSLVAVLDEDEVSNIDAEGRRDSLAIGAVACQAIVEE